MYNNIKKINWFDCRISSLWFYKFVGEGNKKHYLDGSIIKARNVALVVFFAEFFLCLFRLGLYSIRRFVISIIINIFFLVLTLGGIYGTLTLNPYLVIIHWGGVLIGYVIFVILMLATLSKTSGDNQGEIFAFYIPLLIEILPLILLIYFNWVIIRFQINYEKKEKIRVETERNEQGNRRGSEEANRNLHINEEHKDFEFNNPIISAQSVQEIKSIFPSLNPHQIGVQKSKNLERICCICFKDNYNNVFIPCGHVCCCSECAKKVFQTNHRCPICKKIIEKYQKIYEA